MLFRYVLARIEGCTTASEVAKSLTILHAIRWVAEAWKQVPSDTIKKCFRKAGILNESFEVVQSLRISEDRDPLLDIDESDKDDDDIELNDEELSELTAKLQGNDDACEVSGMTVAEDDVPVCAELSDDKRDEEFMSELGPTNKFTHLDGDSDEDSDDEDSEPIEVPPPRLNSVPEAMSCLGEICEFLEYRGYTKEVNSSNTLLDDLARLHCASLTKQTSITDYF